MAEKALFAVTQAQASFPTVLSIRDMVLQFRENIRALNKLSHLNLQVNNLPIQKLNGKEFSEITMEAQCSMNNNNHVLVIVPTSVKLHKFTSLALEQQYIEFCAMVHMHKYNLAIPLNQSSGYFGADVWNVQQNMTFEYGVDFLIDLLTILGLTVNAAIVKIIQYQNPNKILKYILLKSKDQVHVNLEMGHLLVNGIEYHQVHVQGAQICGIAANGIRINIDMNTLQARY